MNLNYILNEIVYWLIKIINFPAQLINYILIVTYAIVIGIKSLKKIREIGAEGYWPIIVNKMHIFVEKLMEFTRFPIPFLKDSPKVLFHHGVMIWIIIIWFAVK